MCLIFRPFSIRKMFSDFQATNKKLRDGDSCSTMVLRRRCSQRVVLLSITFLFSFYLSTLLFGSFHVPAILRLTDLTSCPACYGASVCPEFYSDQITLDSGFFTKFMNAKNVYYGHTKMGVKIVVKKLAHDSEFAEFDRRLCKAWQLKRNCKAADLLNLSSSVIKDKIVDLVHYDWQSPPATPRKGLIFCPNADGIMDYIASIRPSGSLMNRASLINIWTMLNLNPEPLVLQSLRRSKGWPVPSYGGVCGRTELLGDAGVPLSTLPLHTIEWHRKLSFVKQILHIAMDFTFKHERYRFYLMDWSLDNLVVNSKDEITFVDLEDVIILDPHKPPEKRPPHWFHRYLREEEGPHLGHEFSFSIQDICSHHLSDHNLYAACHLLAEPSSQILYPIPDEYKDDTVLVNKLLDCASGKGDRFRLVPAMIKDIESRLHSLGFRAGEAMAQKPVMPNMNKPLLR